MKIICAYSAIQFSCEHMPGMYGDDNSCHPIFNLPQRKLLNYTKKWAAGELSPIENYLLFIALLKSTELVSFRVQCNVSEKTESVIANNMEKLIKIAAKVTQIKKHTNFFPHFIITQETKSLVMTPHWIQSWEDTYKEYLDGYKKSYDSKNLIDKERALERLIRNPHNHVSTYSSKIAEWASVAGSFPEFNIKSPFSGLPISCSDYWKILIKKAASEETLHQIRQKDLEELIEHCETNIPIGSIYSHELFKVLRTAKKKQEAFLELGDMDIVKTTYQILTSNDSAEHANIRAMIQSAPAEKPKPESYPSKMAYLVAQARWNMAQKYKMQDFKSSQSSQSSQS